MPETTTYKLIVKLTYSQSPFQRSAVRFIFGPGFGVLGLALSLCLFIEPVSAQFPTQRGIFPGQLANVPLEQEFRKFIENPQTVGRLVFRIKGPTLNGADADGFQDFYAKWQKNAFIVQQVSSLNDFPIGDQKPSSYHPELMSAGCYDDYYWFIGSNNFQEWTADGNSAKRKENPVYTVNQSIMGNLADIMNLGVRNAEIGSIKWQGDSFQTKSVMDSSLEIQGTLSSSNGRPTQMTLKYGQFDWLVTYYYAKPFGLVFLPSGWTIYFVDNGKKMKYMDVQILDFDVMAEKSENRDEFLPKKISNIEKVKYHIIFSNGVAYASESNSLVRVPMSIPLVHFSSKNNDTVRLVARSLIVIIFLTPLAYLAARQMKQTKNKTKNR